MRLRNPVAMSLLSGELKMVLEFLKGARGYQELDKDYGSTSHFGDVDGCGLAAFSARACGGGCDCEGRELDLDGWAGRFAT